VEANSAGGQGSRRAVKPGGGGGGGGDGDGSFLLCKVQERVKKVAVYLSGSLHGVKSQKTVIFSSCVFCSGPG
jgi:hypothetical protein